MQGNTATLTDENGKPLDDKNARQTLIRDQVRRSW